MTDRERITALTGALFAIVNTTAAIWRDAGRTEIEIASNVMAAFARLSSTAIAGMARQAEEPEPSRKAFIGLLMDQIDVTSKLLMSKPKEEGDGSEVS